MNILKFRTNIIIICMSIFLHGCSGEGEVNRISADGNLGSIDDTSGSIDDTSGSIDDTSGSIDDTSGSIDDTSGSTDDASDSTSCYGTGTSFIDTENYTGKSFIDLTNMTVDTIGTSITVTITVSNLPSTLTFNHSLLSDGRLNYKWSVLFDIDKDGTESKNDLSMSIQKFKFPGSSEATGSILANTQENLWIKNDNGLSLLAAINSSIYENTFTMSVLKSAYTSLNNIDSSTPVCFETFFNDGSYEESDYSSF